MSSDFKLVNVVDAQLEDISHEITLPIHTGASSNTYQQFPSNSNNTSQLIFNVQVPSLSTALSRKILIQSKITLQIDFRDDIQENETVFSYAESDALQAFPLNSLISTAQASINNCSVTVNENQIIAPLLRMYKAEELEKYNSLCPSLCDAFYLYYAQAQGSNNNVLGGYNVGSYNNQYIPRGAFPVRIVNKDTGVELTSYKIVAGAPPQAGDPATYPRSILIDFVTTEPLLFLSPFISGNSNNASAFLGINNMTITLNINNAKKVFSSGTYAKISATAKAPTISNISLVKFEEPKLLLNFFTLPPTLYDKIAPKNVNNYLQYATYTYQYTNTITSGNSTTISFNNVQLNQIPQKMIIVARKKLSEQNWNDSNSFMVIENISMNFNNKAGLLSSANQQQLFNMSVRNGSQQNYYEFSGSGAIGGSYGVDSTGAVVQLTNGGNKIKTSGSLLVIDPALDLGLDAQYTDGSSGQYNVQFNISVHNQYNVNYSPEILLICVNSGIFTTLNGTSTIQTGLYTQEMVLDTKSKTSIMDSLTYDKIVGGALENVNSISKHIKHMFHNHSKHEDDIDNGRGHKVEEGGSESGGVMSAGSVSAGGLKKRFHRYGK